MKLETIKAKINADHAKMYDKIFSRVNIKNGDSILLVTWFHPYYYHTLKKTYPHSFILNIEDTDIVNLLWDNDLTAVVALDLEDKNSLIKYTKENKMKFDHIIANPPYSLGNQITATILNNVDFEEYVNLMPVSKYKGGKIYQHLKPNSLVKVTWDGDAVTNPQIAELTKSRDEKVTEIDFNTWCYDETWKKFYLLNMNREDTFDDYQKKYTLKYKKIFNIKPDTWFAYTERSTQDGVHRTENCWDYRWNIQLIDDVPCPNKEHATDKSQMAFLFIKFNTKEEKDNFCKYWYRGGLSNKLLKGLNRSTGECRAAIPKIDWTKEWTDEEILKDYGYTDEEIKELLK